MGIGEIIAFIRALPEAVKILGQIVNSLEQLKQDSINRQIEIIKSDVTTTLKQIEKAGTNEERKRLSIDLANRMSK